jgi:hypothetical protein
MVLTNFPNGVASFGLPVLPGMQPTTGKVLFVHYSTGTNTDRGGLTPAQPLKTIDYAIGLCTASKGDMIVVMPGHSESISGAGAITADVAGVSIVGLGWGGLRPLITLASTATTIAISAANVTFRNLRIAVSVDAVVKCFNITAAGATLDAVDFVETASVAAIQFVLTNASADDLLIQNCSWVQSQTAASATMAWIGLVGADRAKIRNNYANLKGYATGNPANGVIVGATTASLDVEIVGNRFVILNSTGNIPISLYSGTTGYAGFNHVHSSKTALAGSIALASAYGAENYASNTVNTAGILDPVADT